MSHPSGELIGVMVIARNLEYLGQVQSTIRYSRKLAALGRLSAGVAHVPNGGSLQIRCERASGRRVAIAFTDTGVGIKPEHLQKIFDLYFTTKAKGSGIGLSMVYRTVQMHDGEIEVQSTPGAGTTFTMLLPRASENSPTK